MEAIEKLLIKRNQENYIQYLEKRISALQDTYDRYKQSEKDMLDNYTRMLCSGQSAIIFDSIVEMQNALQKFKKIYNI